MARCNNILKAQAQQHCSEFILFRYLQTYGRTSSLGHMRSLRLPQPESVFLLSRWFATTVGRYTYREAVPVRRTTMHENKKEEQPYTNTQIRNYHIQETSMNTHIGGEGTEGMRGLDICRCLERGQREIKSGFGLYRQQYEISFLS